MALAVLLALATPAFPQPSSMDLAADEEGNLVAPGPSEYQVTEDGTLIIGGDVLVDCAEVGIVDETLERATPAVRAQEGEARNEAIRSCRTAGFSTAANVPLVALPETGGAPPLLLAGLLLASEGLLAIRGTLKGRGNSVRPAPEPPIEPRLRSCRQIDDAPVPRYRRRGLGSMPQITIGCAR